MVSGISSQSMCSIASFGDNALQIAVPAHNLSRQTSATLTTKMARQMMLVANATHLHDRLRFHSIAAGMSCKCHTVVTASSLQDGAVLHYSTK